MKGTTVVRKTKDLPCRDIQRFPPVSSLSDWHRRLTDAASSLLIVGLLAIPSAKGDGGAKWGQAVLMFLLNVNYQMTLGVSSRHRTLDVRADAILQPIGYSILAETSSTRLRAFTVGIARNMHSVLSVSSGLIGTYQLNPTAWNWKGFSALFWVRPPFSHMCHLC